MSTVEKDLVLKEKEEPTPPSPVPVTIDKAIVEKPEDLTSAEEHVRRVSTNEKSEEAQRQQSVHGDLSPQEILNYFGQAVKKQSTTKNVTKTAQGVASGKINVNSVTSASEKKVENFTMNFLKALVPSPTMVGDLLSTEYASEVVRNNTAVWSLGEAAQATNSLHRDLRGHVFQSRVSATARKCTVEGCEEYHFRPADVCYTHDHLNEDLYNKLLEKMRIRRQEKSVLATESVSPKRAAEALAESPVPDPPTPSTDMPDTNDQDTASATTPTKAPPSIDSPAPAAFTHSKPAEKTSEQLLQEQIAQRRKMVYHAETYPVNPTVVQALYSQAEQVLATFSSEVQKANLPAIVLQDKVEVAELFHQFQVLDGDKDGILSPADVLNHARSIDIDWLTNQQSKPPAEVLHIAERWLAASHPSRVGRWTFVDYLVAIHFYREIEKSFHHRRQTKEDEEENDEKLLLGNNIAELLRTAFWDLRMIVLLRPMNHLSGRFALREETEVDGETKVTSVPFQGHLLKRGYFFANERLNAFRYRYFKAVGMELAYYKEVLEKPAKASPTKVAPVKSPDADTKTDSTPPEDEGTAIDEKAGENQVPAGIMVEVSIEDPAQSSAIEEETTANATTAAASDVASTLRRDPKGTIPLQEIALVDFSPKTLLKFNRSLPYESAEDFAQANYVVFKVTLFNGRRFTIAGKMVDDKEPTVLDWAGYFYWWAEVSRRIVSWKEQWGSGRSHRITLRDWVNAGAVIAKVAMIKEKKEKMTTTGALLNSAKYLYDKNTAPVETVKKESQGKSIASETDSKDEKEKEEANNTIEETKEVKEDELKENADVAKEEAEKTESNIQPVKDDKNADVKLPVSAKTAAQVINQVSDLAGVNLHVSKKEVETGTKLVNKALSKRKSTSNKTEDTEAGEETVEKGTSPKKEAQKKEEDNDDDDDEFKLNDRDRFYLEVVGLSEDKLDEAGGIVVLAVKSYYVSQYTVEHFDKHYAFSIGKTIVTTLYYTFNVFQYAAAAQNRIDSNRYGVLWDSASNTRDCGVCHYVFPTLSLRRTKTKHHCRVCGRVVCHTCSSTKVFLDVTKRLERVCKQCIEQNGPPKNRLLAGNQGKRKSTDDILRQHTNQVARNALKSSLGVDEDNEDEEDERDSEDEDK